jgi:hypothetical protein
MVGNRGSVPKFEEETKMSMTVYEFIGMEDTITGSGYTSLSTALENATGSTFIALELADEDLKFIGSRVKGTIVRLVEDFIATDALNRFFDNAVTLCPELTPRRPYEDPVALAKVARTVRIASFLVRHRNASSHETIEELLDDINARITLELEEALEEAQRS